MAEESDDVFVLKWNDYNSVMTSSFAMLRKTEQVIWNQLENHVSSVRQWKMFIKYTQEIWNYWTKLTLPKVFLIIELCFDCLIIFSGFVIYDVRVVLVGLDCQASI